MENLWWILTGSPPPFLFSWPEKDTLLLRKEKEFLFPVPGNDARWYWITLGSGHTPLPNYCKKLTLSWLKLGRTYPCEKDLPINLPFAVDTLFVDAKNRIRSMLDMSIIHLCYKTNSDTLQPSQLQWCTYCHGCKQCIHTPLLYHISHLH